MRTENQIPSLFHDMYVDLEKTLASHLAYSVARHRSLDKDDAVQEARVAIFKAMANFDFNKVSRGGFVPYMREVVVNSHRTGVSAALAQSRCPRVEVQTAEGEWILKPLAPASYDSLLEARSPLPGIGETPEALVDEHTRVRRCEVFCEELKKKLCERELAVFECRMNPPEQILAMMAEDGCDEPKNKHISIHLGIDKAHVDWAIHKIRVAATLLINGCFQEDFEQATGSDWPVINISKGMRVHNKFIERTLRSRRLKGNKIGNNQVQTCALGTRTVQKYDWGSIVYVEMSGVVWTAVLEGSFNPRDGIVTGRSGARMYLPIPMYGQLAKALSGVA